MTAALKEVIASLAKSLKGYRVSGFSREAVSSQAGYIGTYVLVFYDGVITVHPLRTVSHLKDTGSGLFLYGEPVINCWRLSALYLSYLADLVWR